MIGLGFCDSLSNWDSLLASNCILNIMSFITCSICSKRPAVQDASVLDLGNDFEIAIAYRNAVFKGLALNNVLVVFRLWVSKVYVRKVFCSNGLVRVAGV